MRTIVRFIGRRIINSQSRKFRIIGRVATFIGVARLAKRTISPVRRVILARDETMEIRITKTGQHTS
jgi:hypothetical protein